MSVAIVIVICVFNEWYAFDWKSFIMFDTVGRSTIKLDCDHLSLTAERPWQHW